MSNICIVVTQMCIIGFDVFSCVQIASAKISLNEIYIWRYFGLMVRGILLAVFV